MHTRLLVESENQDEPRNGLVTGSPISKDNKLFKLAFDLAFFIHGNKEIAFFIAEDALDGLSSLLGYQKRNRAPSERLRGFLKWGERSRPVRKTLIFNEHQMLQWLVYKESQLWEQLTEKGEGFYYPNEEDLVIRYIEYLTFLNVRRGSFYVTLSICSLLHQLGRRETRVFYDVLTQSDAARMKDTAYIGKQRVDLFSRILQRFAAVAETTIKSGNERQIVLRRSNQPLTNLVQESLRRFTPWETGCVIGAAFDVTDIPELYFAGTSSTEKDVDLNEDEDIVEMNRIHTVLHPDCLSLFVNQLENYVHSLPDTDLDSTCDFDPINQRIVLPHFTQIQNGPPRDRYQPPTLRSEDYVRLERTLEARGHRKRAFVPNTISIYADGQSLYTFDPAVGNSSCLISSESSFVEVRGRDVDGEVLLACVPLGGLATSVEEFEDSIIHEGGHTLEVKLRNLQRNSDSPFRLEISYRHRPNRLMTLAQTIPSRLNETLNQFRVFLIPNQSALRFVIPLILTLIIAVIGWFLVVSKRNALQEPTLAPQYQPYIASTPSPQSVNPSAAEAIQHTRNTKRAPVLLAEARWSSNPDDALAAISLEPTRSEMRPLEFSGDQTRVFISLPFYNDNGRKYERYRITISAPHYSSWRSTLRAPDVSHTTYSHIIQLKLLHQANMDEYKLEVKGVAGNAWHRIGHLRIKHR